jgi:hypothetical protein
MMKLFSLIGVLISLWILWYFWIKLPAEMARRRDRDPLGWVLLTWMLSPLTVIILLLLVGNRK